MRGKLGLALILLVFLPLVMGQIHVSRQGVPVQAKLCGGTDKVSEIGEDGVVTCSTDTGGAAPVRELCWDAASMAPLETNFAPLEKIGATIEKFARSFDDTTEEFVNMKFKVPGDVDTSGTVTFRAYVQSKTHVASKNVSLDFEHLAVADSEDSDPATYTATKNSGDKALPDAQDDDGNITWTETVSTLAWTANDLVYARFSRVDAAANDLAGDMHLKEFCVEIPR